jgi:hypothetical protein
MPLTFSNRAQIYLRSFFYRWFFMRLLVLGLFLNFSVLIIKVFQRLFDRCFDLALVITLDCEWLVIAIQKVD